MVSALSGRSLPNERPLDAHSIEHLMPLAAVVFSVNCVVHVLLHAWKKLVMGVCVCVCVCVCVSCITVSAAAQAPILHVIWLRLQPHSCPVPITQGIHGDFTFILTQDASTNTSVPFSITHDEGNGALLVDRTLDFDLGQQVY